MRYLREGGIRDLPNGEVQMDVIRSRADLLTWHVGVSVERETRRRAGRGRRAVMCPDRDRRPGMTNFDPARVSRRDFGLAWNQVRESGGVVGDEVRIALEVELARGAARRVTRAPGTGRPARHAVASPHRRSSAWRV